MKCLSQKNTSLTCAIFILKTPLLWCFPSKHLSQNVPGKAASAGMIWCFVRIPGRSISHIAAEAVSGGVVFVFLFEKPSRGGEKPKQNQRENAVMVVFRMILDFR